LFLHGYENLSLTLREKHRLRAFESGVLKRIFGPMGEADLLGDCRLIMDRFVHPNDAESYAGGSVSSW
jgi:hypothetical protein